MDRHLKLLPTEDMTKLVVDLYGHIFLFLSSVMDWIMKKRSRRLLDSFTENFNDHFRNQLNKINDKAARIRSIASQSLMAEGRVTRLVVESLERDVRLGLEGDVRHQAEMRLFAERIERHLSKAEEDRRLEYERVRQLGGSVVILLEADAAKWLQAEGRPLLTTAPSVPFLHPGPMTSGKSSISNVGLSHLPSLFQAARKLTTIKLKPTRWKTLPSTRDTLKVSFLGDAFASLLTSSAPRR